MRIVLYVSGHVMVMIIIEIAHLIILYKYNI
jgi:hypothetical protein